MSFFDLLRVAYCVWAKGASFTPHFRCHSDDWAQAQHLAKARAQGRAVSCHRGAGTLGITSNRGHPVSRPEIRTLEYKQKVLS